MKLISVVASSAILTLTNSARLDEEQAAPIIEFTLGQLADMSRLAGLTPANDEQGWNDTYAVLQGCDFDADGMLSAYMGPDGTPLGDFLSCPQAGYILYYASTAKLMPF